MRTKPGQKVKHLAQQVWCRHIRVRISSLVLFPTSRYTGQWQRGKRDWVDDQCFQETRKERKQLILKKAHVIIQTYPNAKMQSHQRFSVQSPLKTAKHTVYKQQMQVFTKPLIIATRFLAIKKGEIVGRAALPVSKHIRECGYLHRHLLTVASETQSTGLALLWTTCKSWGCTHA